MQISENDNANVPQVAENNSWTPRKCKRTRSPRFFSFDTTSLSGSLIFFKVSVFCCFLLCDGWNKINLIFYQVCFAHEILAGVNCASCSFEYFTNKVCGLWHSNLCFLNHWFSVILGSSDMLQLILFLQLFCCLGQDFIPLINCDHVIPLVIQIFLYSDFLVKNLLFQFLFDFGVVHKYDCSKHLLQLFFSVVFVALPTNFWSTKSVENFSFFWDFV